MWSKFNMACALVLMGIIGIDASTIIKPTRPLATHAKPQTSTPEIEQIRLEQMLELSPRTDSCTDTSKGAKDTDGDGCDVYLKSWCGGQWNDNDFKSDTMCCVCGGGGGSSSGYAEGQLQKHNTYRTKHHSPTMILDPDLTTAAQNHVNKLASAGKWLSISDHDPNLGGVGENIGQSCSSAAAPDYDEVTDAWYSEVKDYDYQAGDKSASCEGSCVIGHFTQVVWKGSTELGIAKATGKIGDWFCTWAVGRYGPKGGNVQGQFTTNVQKP